MLTAYWTSNILDIIGSIECFIEIDVIVLIFLNTATRKFKITCLAHVIFLWNIAGLERTN